MTGLRVVLAEDDVLLRESLASLLQHSGFEVVGQAGDGPGLLEQVRRVAPDLVVADIRMPPTHTTEGLQAARAGQPGQGGEQATRATWRASARAAGGQQLGGGAQHRAGGGRRRDPAPGGAGGPGEPVGGPRSSALPVASAAAVSRSAAAQAMSAACARRAGRARRVALGGGGARGVDVAASCAGEQVRAGGGAGRPARQRARSAARASRGSRVARRTRPAARPGGGSGRAGSPRTRPPGRAGPGWPAAGPAARPRPARRRTPARTGPRPRSRPPRGAARPGPPRRSSGPRQPGPGPPAGRPGAGRPGPRRASGAAAWQGQVGGQLPAAEPHRAAPSAVWSPGRATAYPVTSPGRGAVAEPDLHAALPPARRRTPARTGRRPRRRTWRRRVVRGGSAWPAAGCLLVLGPGRPPAGGPVRPGPPPQAVLGLDAPPAPRRSGSSRCAGRPGGRPAGPGRPRCGCGCRRGGPRPRDPFVLLAARGQAGAVHDLRGDPHPRAVAEVGVPGRGADRAVPHRPRRARSPSSASGSQQAGQQPEVPVAVRAQRWLELGRVAPAGHQVRVDVLDAFPGPTGTTAGWRACFLAQDPADHRSPRRPRAASSTCGPPARSTWRPG